MKKTLDLAYQHEHPITTSIGEIRRPSQPRPTASGGLWRHPTATLLKVSSFLISSQSHCGEGGSALSIRAPDAPVDSVPIKGFLLLLLPDPFGRLHLQSFRSLVSSY